MIEPDDLTHLNLNGLGLTDPSNLPFLPQPLFPFPLLLQQLTQQNLLASTSTPQTPKALKKVSESKFHGRHSIWRHFNVQRELNLYRCEVASCAATYTWPPSTTVAGRHLRDKHPEVYNQVLNEEADRRNRKRNAEVNSGVDGEYKTECSSPPTSNNSSIDDSVFSPDFIKRVKYDEDFMGRLNQFMPDPIQCLQNHLGTQNLDYLLCKQGNAK